MASATPTFEVEMKFRVESLDVIRAAIAELGGQFRDERLQVDEYLAHPSRDFAVTDEALRLRRDGTRFCVTYKGPKLDRATKTRKEIEIPIVDQEAASRWMAIFESLGFRRVTAVVKRRSEANVTWRETRFTIALDRFEGERMDSRSPVGGGASPSEAIGSIGQFVEVELISNQGDIDAAKAMVRAFAEYLGLPLRDLELRSYLEMVLGQR